MSMDIGDKRLAVLILLVKLGVLGTRKVSISMAASMILGMSPPSPPRCSIQLASIGPTLDYIEFAPLRMCKEDESWQP